MPSAPDVRTRASALVPFASALPLTADLSAALDLVLALEREPKYHRKFQPPSSPARQAVRRRPSAGARTARTDGMPALACLLSFACYQETWSSHMFRNIPLRRYTA
jgi:hypothetical protein